jgi:CrcB protein
MREVVFVAVGGALGAVARYGVGIAAAATLGKGFPWGTLLVNVVGCFAMGIVLQIMAGLESQFHAGSPEHVRGSLDFWHKAVAIGFLGGLTTFSTFGADTIREAQTGNLHLAFSNVVASVLLSLAAVWCGMALATALQ